MFYKVNCLAEQIDKDLYLKERDKDVLSVALKELLLTTNQLRTQLRLKRDNPYKDMEDYYEDKVNNLYRDVAKKYLIVDKLYSVARDGRLSLMQYLEKNKPFLHITESDINRELIDSEVF